MELTRILEASTPYGVQFAKWHRLLKDAVVAAAFGSQEDAQAYTVLEDATLVVEGDASGTTDDWDVTLWGYGSWSDHNSAPIKIHTELGWNPDDDDDLHIALTGLCYNRYYVTFSRNGSTDTLTIQEVNLVQRFARSGRQ